MQWPTSTGVKLAASVFGLDASTRTFHSGGFASFRWRRVVTMIYGGVGVWRALVPVFAGFALLCQRAILEHRSAAAMAKANDMEQWGYALTRHAALMLSVAINTQRRAAAASLLVSSSASNRRLLLIK